MFSKFINTKIITQNHLKVIQVVSSLPEVLVKPTSCLVDSPSSYQQQILGIHHMNPYKKTQNKIKY